MQLTFVYLINFLLRKMFNYHADSRGIAIPFCILWFLKVSILALDTEYSNYTSLWIHSLFTYRFLTSLQLGIVARRLILYAVISLVSLRHHQTSTILITQIHPRHDQGPLAESISLPLDQQSKLGRKADMLFSSRPPGLLSTSWCSSERMNVMNLIENHGLLRVIQWENLWVQTRNCFKLNSFFIFLIL